MVSQQQDSEIAEHKQNSRTTIFFHTFIFGSKPRRYFISC